MKSNDQPNVSMERFQSLNRRQFLRGLGVCLALPVFYTISWSLMIGCLPFIRITIGRLLAQRGYSLERAVPNPAGPPEAEGLLSTP